MEITFPPEQDSTLHFGLWYGKCRNEKGHSRSHQSEILTTTGGLIYTTEDHPELKVSQRVTYRVGFDRLGIETLAVNVAPVEPVGAKIASRNKGR